MKFKELTIPELRAKHAELVEKAHTINDKVEAERREMNDEEKAEWRSIKSDLDAIVRRIELLTMEEDPTVQVDAARARMELPMVFAASRARMESGARFRSFINSPDGPDKIQHGVMIELRESASAIGTGEAANVIPVLVDDFIEPLQKGLVINQVGIKMKTGLKANVSYPIMPAFEANFVDEKVAVTDTVFSADALKPQPHRITISVPLTNLANLQTDGRVYEWILNNLAVAIARTLNRWMFQPSAVASGIFGAMAYSASNNKIQQAQLSAVPTYAELVAMRGAVQKTGAYQDGTYAYIMSGEMAATLEATRRFDSGDTPILVDGKIGGVPVLLTEYVEATGANTFNATPKHVGFGRWSDAIIGQFGDMKLTIDPYTGAKAGITNMVLDTQYSVDLIRKESFVIGTVKASS
jgi:HK97 family phage major capsid protein